MTPELQQVPRTVKPRNRTYKHLAVIAIADQHTLDENGEISMIDPLRHTLPNMQPTLFVKQSSADFVALLDEWFRDNSNWQWRATTNERDICRPDGVRVAARISTVIHYFGFKHGNYHKIIDPVCMYGHRLDKVWPGPEDVLTRLLQWGIAVRDFCAANNIEVRPTTGGISAQFLTDKRFYPHRRRKVPMRTNERAREATPGNHYMLTVHPTPHQEFTGLYLDQRRAHHYHARTTSFPAADSLYAYGRFNDLQEVAFDDVWPSFTGLYCLDLVAPTRIRRSNWIRQLDRQFIFSNELPHLSDLGYRVKGVRAAWGSLKRDTGLAKYARFAEEQLDKYGDKPWLKPLLLSAYGTLATRPQIAESVFRSAKTGEDVTLRTGHRRLHGKRVASARKLEPRIANVIHRGMIEAATRSESIGYAQHLHDQGYRILSIYADAVIVRDDPENDLPPSPDPWRLKTRLNHLQFINQQAFTSGEMTKLPGICRELRPYRQHSPGHAPRRILYEALTGKPVHTDRRI